jgi:ABC-type bacteriocin/lantibiotic exporter with double-glycine peptidase domain
VLLKRPRILIFDEATSNLDNQTAEQFARTINQLKGKVTILFIAHRVPKGLQVDQTVIVGLARAPEVRGTAGAAAVRTGCRILRVVTSGREGV